MGLLLRWSPLVTPESAWLTAVLTIAIVVVETNASSRVKGNLDLFRDVQGETPVVLSVEQLNQALRRHIEGNFPLVWVRGEISSFKIPSSGHFYFNLKDEKSVVRAVMFRGANSRLVFRPQDGMEVILRGRVTVYEPRGDYQITVDMMEPVGAGALQKAFEQLKAKLKSEGLTDPERKRELPLFPKKVALVTSPTGAAIQDMISVLQRRSRGVEIILVPTLVQGASAAPAIVAALRLAYRIPGVDVVIVGRGGGSMEDLWCFNEEEVARTIAVCPVPIVSAVGHEVDFTIADFVADIRAPTPSAAAELVARSSEEVLLLVRSKLQTLRLGTLRRWSEVQTQLSKLTERLVDPRRRLQDWSVRNDELFARLEQAAMRWLRSQQNLLTVKLAHLEGLNPMAVLLRGYSVAKQKSRVLTSAKQVQTGDTIEVWLADGRLSAEVKDIHITN